MLHDSKAMKRIYCHVEKVGNTAMCLYGCCGMMCNYLRLVYIHIYKKKNCDYPTMHLNNVMKPYQKNREFLRKLVKLLEHSDNIGWNVHEPAWIVHKFEFELS